LVKGARVIYSPGHFW